MARPVPVGPTLVVLGRRSYSFYIWHVPVLVFVGHQLADRPIGGPGARSPWPRSRSSPRSRTRCSRTEPRLQLAAGAPPTLDVPEPAPATSTAGPDLGADRDPSPRLGREDAEPRAARRLTRSTLTVVRRAGLCAPSATKVSRDTITVPMKGLILSAGAGTRLRPITHTSAKQLVPVANKPILFYGIEAMADAGVTEIGIVIGETGARGRGGGRRRQPVRGHGHVPPPGGAARPGPRRAHRSRLPGRRRLRHVPGRQLLQQGLTGFVDRFEAAQAAVDTPTLDGPEQPPSAQILLCKVPDPQRFGVAAVDAKGHVVRLIEKPVDPPSDLALVGVYLFTPAIHEAVAAIEPSARGELEITDAIQWLIDHGHPVIHEELEGWWLDTGKKDPLLESNRRVLEMLEPRIDGTLDDASSVDGRVVIEAGAELVGSQVRGPAIIGARTRLVNTYVGPFTAIAADCEVVDTEIDHSVVLEDARIVGVPRMTDSLVGRHTEITRSGARPTATRLMVGDHSSIDLA